MEQCLNYSTGLLHMALCDLLEERLHMSDLGTTAFCQQEKTSPEEFLGTEFPQFCRAAIVLKLD